MTIDRARWLEAGARLGAAASLATTLILSLLPAVDMPEELSLVSDKLEHAAAYAAIAGCTALGFARPAALRGALAAAVLGGAIEIVQQAMVPGRSGDLGDWLADVAGVIVGLALGLAMRRATVDRWRHAAR